MRQDSLEKIEVLNSLEKIVPSSETTQEKMSIEGETFGKETYTIF